MTAVLEPAEHIALRLLWVDLTRKCQLGCVHCLNDSGAEGTHGTMSRQNWISVLDQAKTSGVSEVRFIGVEIVAVHEGQRTDNARREMEALGVAAVRVSRVRPFGRAAGGRSPDAARLCGRCGTGAASVGPTGEVSPCVFSTWMRVGDVRDASLADILSSAEMVRANAFIQAACDPEEEELDDDDECSPGFPGSGCSPRK